MTGRKKRLRVESYVKGRPRSMVVDKVNGRGVGAGQVSSDGSIGTTVEGVEMASDKVKEVRSESAWEINPGLVKRKAYEAYMIHFASKAEILKLGMPEDTLDTWLYSPTSNQMSWKMQRDHYYDVEMRAFMEGKAEVLKKTAARMLNIANRSLQELDESGDTVNIPQLEKLMNSFGKIQHWIQIEDGKPTNITESYTMTQKGLQGLMEELQELDPLLDYDQSGKVN